MSVPATSGRAAGWKRNEPQEVELPSGNVALLQRPHVTAMMRRGEVPNPLLAVALKGVSGDTSEMAPEDFAAGSEYVAFIVAKTFVDPQVVLDGEVAEGALHFDDLDDADVEFVFGWAEGTVRELVPFRDGRGGAAAGGGGDALGDTAEPDAGDR